MFGKQTAKSFTATVLAGSLLALAIGTPASAGFFDRKKKYVSTTTHVNENAYAIGNTGRDRVQLDNVRLGATVGDSVVRNAPTVNTGRFDQLRDYRSNNASKFNFIGGRVGRDFTQANTYYNGLTFPLQYDYMVRLLVTYDDDVQPEDRFFQEVAVAAALSAG